MTNLIEAQKAADEEAFSTGTPSTIWQNLGLARSLTETCLAVLDAEALAQRGLSESRRAISEIISAGQLDDPSVQEALRAWNELSMAAGRLLAAQTKSAGAPEVKSIRTLSLVPAAPNRGPWKKCAKCQKHFRGFLALEKHIKAGHDAQPHHRLIVRTCVCGARLAGAEAEHKHRKTCRAFKADLKDRMRSHAKKLHHCPCGYRIRGNSFFKHAKHCPSYKGKEVSA